MRVEFAEVKRAANGNWRNILTSLGVPAESLINRHGPCPGCGGTDRFRFDDKSGDGTYICSQSDKVSGDGFTLLSHVFGWSVAESLKQVSAQLGGFEVREARPMPAPIAKPKRDRLSGEWQEYWDALGPIAGIGRDYLESRLCALPPRDGDLRYDPAARHPSGHVGGCLVALITDILTQAPISLHRTWINADGTKPAVDKPRLLLGDSHRKSGGVVRLWPDDAVCWSLGLGEGVETALSLAHCFKPVWAAIDAGNLSQFPLLPYVESLTIAADYDPAGEKAAQACADRWLDDGRNVQIFKSARESQDANDFILEAH
ncbi:Zinc-binding domain of primase-helicase [Caballeronia sordidicola]|uniref:Zinc-binding domain of primase-helicase n=2 Tax=Caballeronia sordidicola TaxID=196367 RepID=A0A158EX20_CABSO|nr:Zinc-binding domain of primase-helicase [Caballeronia sordidicola]